MEFLDVSHFTEEQSWIIHLRVSSKCNRKNDLSSNTSSMEDCSFK